MREELKNLWSAIASESLPSKFDDLLNDVWDADENRFHTQEGFILDFKDRAPTSFTDDFGSSIVRLAIAFYNTFGGLIIFGVIDQKFTLSNLPVNLPIEGFNETFKRVTGRPVECVFKQYTVPSSKAELGVLLVPRRSNVRPVRLEYDLGKYKKGTLWFRDRHQVATDTLKSVALIYSDRTELPSESGQTALLPIHKSIPPSPATMHKFVGRDNLMGQLWDWFVFSDRPRTYVHGPGGSGKSTLAHEFSRSVAEHGYRIILPNGDHVDYVLYLSAKETELNPLSGVQQDFALRQFDDLPSQLRQILFHSGNFEESTVQSANEEELARLVDDLFNSFSGLIVLDDIDALSRRSINTGEELLFLAAARSRHPTRILYTLRYPPPNAAGSGVAVPGLNDDEFFDFLNTCCAQFEVAPPAPQICPRIQLETNGLPLLIETVVGLRRVCGSFEEALAQFKDRGGDDARRYLYQREYDRLERNGKSRELLAALMLLQEPVQFTTLKSLLGFSPEKVADAISESGSIFITAQDGPHGETLYQLALPSIPFIRAVSARLGSFRLIERKIELYRREHANLTPEEAALVHRLLRLARSGQYHEVVSICDAIDVNDACLANPRVQAILAQALIELGPQHLERARECFRFAESMKHSDISMMRAWYYMETRTGYGLEEAKRICNSILGKPGTSKRLKSEFLSKLAWCNFSEANSLSSVSIEKAAPLYRLSIEQYLEALALAEEVPGMSILENLSWVERPIDSFLRMLKGDLAPYMDMIEALAAKKIKISRDGADAILRGIVKAYIPNDERTRKRAVGLFTRAIGKLNKAAQKEDDSEGLDYLIDSFEAFCNQLAVA